MSDELNRIRQPIDPEASYGANPDEREPLAPELTIQGLEEGLLEEPVPPRSRPLLARLLNGIGIPTSPGVNWALDWLQILAIAGLLAWGTMTYGVVRMRVPTGSMEPTIMPGDSFFVDKFSYITGLKQPQPGDIVVFWHTERGRMCRSQFLAWEWGELRPCRERYVKRLIGLGGQTVTIRQGKVYIDGELMTDPAFNHDYVCSSSDPRDPLLRTNECTWEVPQGKFFVLGDNTRNSSDSRYWGFADMSDFIGEPFFRVWPPGRIGPMNGYFGSPR
jgi:signal peptidase I